MANTDRSKNQETNQKQGKDAGPGYGRRWLERGERITKETQLPGRPEFFGAIHIGLINELEATYTVPIDVGDGYRLLELKEKIRPGDQWRIQGPWVRVSAVDNEVGLTVEEDRQGIKDLIYRRPLTAEVSKPAKPSEDPSFEEAQASIMCGCGHHEVDPSGDLYRQHANWMSSDVLVETSPDENIIETCLDPAPEPILPGPDLLGDDVAPDLTDSQLRALRAKGVR